MTAEGYYLEMTHENCTLKPEAQKLEGNIQILIQKLTFLHKE
jgi:hypothetical protein